MPIAELSVDLVARLARLEAGMNQASRLAEQNASRISAAYAQTTKVAQGLGNTLKGAFAGITITALVRSIVGGLDALVDLRDATGASIENLSALEDLAVRTGTSFDGMSGIVIKFNKALADAKPGSDMARVFDAIGVSVTELKKIDPAEALRRVAVAFQGYADDGNKARTFQELFGKSVREAAPFMAELAAQTRLTGTVTTEAAKEAERLSQNVAGLQKNVLDLARQMAGPLNSTLTATIDLFRKLDGWQQRMREENDTRLSWGGASAKEDAEAAIRYNAILQSQEKRVLVLADAKRQLAAIEDRQAQRARREEDALRAGAGPRGGPGLQPAVDTRPSVAVKDKPERVKGVTSEATNEIDRYVQSLRDATISEVGLTAVEKARLDLMSGKLAGATAAQKAEIIGLAEGIDALKDKTEALISAETLRIRAEKAGYDQTEIDLKAQALQETIDNSEKLRRIIAATTSGQYAAIAKEIDFLNAALEDGRLSAEQFNEAMNDVAKTVPQPLKEAADQMTVFAEEAARNIQDSLGNTISSALKGDFDNIGEAWKNLILDMIAQAAAAQLAKSLFGDFGKGGSSEMGGWVGSLLGLIGSASGNSSGGAAKPFSVHRVNELGPEGLTVDGKDYLMMGSRGGRVTPNSSMGGGGSLTIHVGSGVSRAEAYAGVRAAIAESEKRQLQSKRRGGVWA